MAFFAKVAVGLLILAFLPRITAAYQKEGCWKLANNVFWYSAQVKNHKAFLKHVNVGSFNKSRVAPEVMWEIGHSKCFKLAKDWFIYFKSYSYSFTLCHTCDIDTYHHQIPEKCVAGWTVFDGRIRRRDGLIYNYVYKTEPAPIRNNTCTATTTPPALDIVSVPKTEVTKKKQQQGIR